VTFYSSARCAAGEAGRWGDSGIPPVTRAEPEGLGGVLRRKTDGDVGGFNALARLGFGSTGDGGGDPAVRRLADTRTFGGLRASK